MSLALDSSSPVAFKATPGTSITSASFTPPVGALVRFKIAISYGGALDPTMSSTGAGLGSWRQVAKNTSGAFSGANCSVYIYEAVVTSSVAMTVKADFSSTGSFDIFGWVEVWTGANSNQTSCATASGTAQGFPVTPYNSTGMATTANNSRVHGIAAMNASGTVGSSDSGSGQVGTNDAAISAYKAADTATSGTSVQLNYTNTGNPSNIIWVSAEILVKPSGAALQAGAAVAVAVAAALSTGILLAGTPTTVSSATASLMQMMGASAAQVSSSASLQTAIQAAAAAIATTSSSGYLFSQAALQGGAASSTSASAVLTNWTTVTLTAPLYTGPNGILDPHLWAGGTQPQVGTVVYYDATYLTVAPNGEFYGTVSDFQAQVEFQDTGGNWRTGTAVFTSGFTAYADIAASAVGSMVTAIQLLAGASSLVSAAASLNAQITLGAQLASVTSASAALTASILLAASVVDAVTASASLQGTNSALAADAISSTTATGLLNAQIQMIAAATALVTAAGNLSAGISFQAAALSSASVSATLTAGTQLNTAVAVATASTAALLTAIQVSGSALSIVQAAANLTAQIQLVASAVSQTNATGDLTTHTGIAGNAQAVTAAVAALSTLITLNVAAFSDTQVNAALLTGIPLLGGAFVTDVVTGNLLATGSPVANYASDPYFVVGQRRQIYTTQFPEVAPTEKRVLTFDYSDDLAPAEFLEGIITASVIASAGSDPNAQGIISGPPSYDPTLHEVLVPVFNLTNDVDYYFTVTAPTSNPNKTVTRFGLLSVRA